MRISTSMLYSNGAAMLTRQQADLQRLQQQISTGRRVLSPADDPVASAQALQVSQEIARTAQQKVSQGIANDKLGGLENQLGAVGDLLQYVRDRVIQAGDAALNAADRQIIAVDAASQFDALVGLANARDAQGEYLFSGFKSDTPAFTGNLSAITYSGDQGQRSMQVSNSRQMPTSLAGDDVFRLSAQPDVTCSPALYGVKVTGAGTYDYYDLRADPQMEGTPAGTGTFTVGEPFNVGSLNASGEELMFNEVPDLGDVLVAGSRDSFSVLSNFVYSLESLTGPAYEATLDTVLGQLDGTQDHLLGLRAQIGSQQVELDALRDMGEDANTRYADTMSRLVGVDYASAVSDFTLQQTYLQASQQSFVKVTGMSLFNYLA